MNEAIMDLGLLRSLLELKEALDDENKRHKQEGFSDRELAITALCAVETLLDLLIKRYSK